MIRRFCSRMARLIRGALNFPNQCCFRHELTKAVILPALKRHCPILGEHCRRVAGVNSENFLRNREGLRSFYF
jgi:hypothetical protein